VIDIIEGDFSIQELVEAARRPDAGAVVAFLGTVRDDGVQRLEVEAFREAALLELERIREEAVSRFGLLSAEVVHRVGSLSLGENIVLIVVSAPHRNEAFEGCRYILEELKKRVPVWKKEIGKEGSRWVGQ
jgi:molybdopterin synthase catalytic subunit